MEDTVETYDALIRSGARRLTGYQRRLFQAEVVTALCGGNARQAEYRFGWGRETVEKGLHEQQHGVRCLENFAAKGRKRSEEKDPQLAADIPRATPTPNSSHPGDTPTSRRPRCARPCSRRDIPRTDCPASARCATSSTG